MEDKIDFIKINKGTLGAINFNNMIPLIENSYHIIDLNNLADANYHKLLSKQIRWLNRNYDLICDKAFLLYNLYKNNKLNQFVKKRCCNFSLLEEKCQEYDSKLVSS